ncbi:MAG: hypothetical protein ACRCTA_06110, partial [Bacilli bacterium]
DLLYELSKNKQCFKSDYLNLIKQNITSSIIIIDTNLECKLINEPLLSLRELPTITKKTCIYINSALSDYIIDKYFIKYSDITIVINNPFYNLITYQKALFLKRLNITIEVLNQANIIALSLNTSNASDQFITTMIKNKVNIAVFDVVKGEISE